MACDRGWTPGLLATASGDSFGGSGATEGWEVWTPKPSRAAPRPTAYKIQTSFYTVPANSPEDGESDTVFAPTKNFYYESEMPQCPSYQHASLRPPFSGHTDAKYAETGNDTFDGQIFLEEAGAPDVEQAFDGDLRFYDHSHSRQCVGGHSDGFGCRCARLKEQWRQEAHV